MKYPTTVKTNYSESMKNMDWSQEHDNDKSKLGRIYTV